MTTLPMPFVLQLRDVTKNYHGPRSARWFRRRTAPVLALADAQLDVRDGEFLAVVGRSGEGKSTLLHLLGGLDHPTSGELWFRGQRLRGRALESYRSRHVGFVFQMYHLLPHRTALDNVVMGLTVAGIPARGVRRLAFEWLERLGLADRANHHPAELSGGERQRVAIARALVKCPSLLLADEPTGNLDHHSREDVLTLLQKLNREQQVTVIMVTHQLDDAERFSDRVVTITDRRLDGRVLS